jgi:hypothetical protein
MHQEPSMPELEEAPGKAGAPEQQEIDQQEMDQQELEQQRQARPSAPVEGQEGMRLRVTAHLLRWT